MIGKTLAHYQVTEKIGEGGMGAVYRATDTRLGRDVAIKVLPDEVAKDPERLARFQREAQLLAALNHSNIAAIYGLEKVEETPFLVMEMIEGRDLADRLSQGAIPVSEALDFARQISEALEEAHERGIIHRDLKPANIKITPEGKVKILDFGLAKALEVAPVGPGDPSLSPTMTAAATRAGVIMGTAAYMSPEQARGEAVDKRSDIWAFGCILLEMITGKGAFHEKTISDTLASVLKTEPNWEAMPSETPGALRRLLLRCLQKESRKRLRDIGEARIGIEEIQSGTSDETATSLAAGTYPNPRPRWGLAALVAVLAAGITAILMWNLGSASPKPSVEKFQIAAKAPQTDALFAPALSPDGSKVVFVAEDELWIRELNQLDARAFAGTRGAQLPFWSPDGEFVGYQKDGGLWKIPIGGGPSAAISGAVGHFGGGAGISWGAGGQIVYARGSAGLSQVSARGGDPQSILEPDPKTEGDLHEPHVLPDGRGVLFVSHRLVEGPDTLFVFSGGERKMLLQFKAQPIRTPVYSPTGHIIYRRQGANAGLWAAPFSLDRLEITGEPFLIVPDGSLPSVASDGSLLYVRGADTAMRGLALVNRDGVVEGTIGQPQTRIASPSVSPDGRQVAVMGMENENWNIWIQDMVRGTHTRLTFNAAQDWDPTWTPDSKQIIFWDGVTRTISIKAADGSGETEKLVTMESSDSGIPSVSPDGKLMAFWARVSETKEDIYYMPLDGSGKATPLLQTSASEDYPQISPNGQYLAYTSDETGRVEVYLTRFPSGKGKWQVSTSGGKIPIWSLRGDKIYYQEDDNLMEVDITAQSTVQLGSPRKLFSAKSAGITFSGYARFDVAPDGEHFVMVQKIEKNDVSPNLVLVRNWLLEFQAVP